MVTYIPQTLKFLFIKHNLKKKLIVYNIKSIICININKISINNKSNFLITQGMLEKNKLNILEKFIINLSNFYLKKILFKGKGYKITKKKQNLTLNFNTSHLTLLILFNILGIKILKNKYLFSYKNIIKLVHFTQIIIKIRNTNIYTKRGIKLAKQKIFKKIGKRT